MELVDNGLFKLVAGLVGDYICALLLEKGISMLRGKKFAHRHALGVFLILIAIRATVKSILFY